MSFNYAATASVASRLLVLFGAPLTFKRTTKGAYDPATGAYAETTSLLTINAAWFDFSQSEIDGDAIQVGDARLLCDPSADEPAIGDVVERDGEAYRVLAVRPLSPGGTDVLRTVQVRR